VYPAVISNLHKLPWKLGFAIVEPYKFLKHVIAYLYGIIEIYLQLLLK